MMTNLFSTFDPSTYFFLSLNWLSTMMSLLMIPLSYWMIPSRYNIILMNLMTTLHKEFKMLMGPSNFKGSTILMISLFIFILMNNFMGLFPYIFTSSSHLIFTLTLALPLWIMFMLFGWINNMNHMFIHLVPQGTPPILMSFMVCIETISNIIRPSTLAIRLAANMIAGHLLLTLLGNTGSMMNFNLLNILVLIQLLLLLLEFAVSIIQSYVFAILSTLYSSEVI
uniref:ATP synthase subunit a n=1 Tax=Omoglymmius wukong TaxID=2983420 RepID=A0A977TLH4_9CARA|nr:ATP synthase F0 subunit 6 [Omoglymmius wukong]UXW93690.1 ATP synthase F0 subunit 6 [Omoglymmius wukong]